MAEVDVGPADLQDGELRSVEVGKRLVLLARDAGCTFALDDWCNHAGCLLSGGRIERAQVICPCHEVGFELASGKVATRPRICDDQPRFEITERDGRLLVTLPDSES
jgi:3-phenylpropionate/trans-cinnamate dioxygenase ferredoxin subunit